MAIREYIPQTDSDKMPSMKHYLHRAGQQTKLIKTEPEIKLLSHKIYRLGMDNSNAQISVLFLNNSEISSELVPEKLQGSRGFSLFYATLGSQLDLLTQDLFDQQKPLEAALLDAWGSESVEALAERVDCILREKYGSGSIRFSPGYSNFNIVHNWDWLQLIAKQDPTPAITVSQKTGILSPRKSVICMIGWEDHNRIS